MGEPVLRGPEGSKREGDDIEERRTKNEERVFLLSLRGALRYAQHELRDEAIQMWQSEGNSIFWFWNLV